MITLNQSHPKHKCITRHWCTTYICWEPSNMMLTRDITGYIYRERDTHTLKHQTFGVIANLRIQFDFF